MGRFRTPMPRRTLLRGLGGVFVGLPFLEAMRSSRAIAAPQPSYTPAGFPKRFVVMFTPNGSVHEAWLPTGAERHFELSEILSPLEPFREKLLVLAGVDQMSGGQGETHQRAMGGMLTGEVVNPGEFFVGGNPPGGWANGISVDQRIARVLGNTTRLRSLELAVQPTSEGSTWTRMSYAGPNQPLPPLGSPFLAFERLFSSLVRDPKAAAWTIPRRRTVLDAVRDDYLSLRARVGLEDRRRLDAHLTALRELEARLGVVPEAVLQGCSAPALKDNVDVASNDNFPLVGKLQMDLLAKALECDLTRVASIQWSRSRSATRFTWLGVEREHHDLSHDGDALTSSVASLVRINAWYAEQLAYLLGRLASIPEGDGTMLDSTLVFWSNELARGNSHSTKNMPYVLAGGLGGDLQMGRFLDFRSRKGTVPHNNLLLSLVNAMGIDDTSFGRAEWCTGPLSGLV